MLKSLLKSANHFVCILMLHLDRGLGIQYLIFIYAAILEFAFSIYVPSIALFVINTLRSWRAYFSRVHPLYAIRFWEQCDTHLLLWDDIFKSHFPGFIEEQEASES